MKSVFRKKVLGILRLLRRNKEAIIGSIIVVVFLLIAAAVAVSNLFGVQITPYNPLQQNVGPIACPSFTCPSDGH